MDIIIAVRDVEASSRWYQSLLGCRSLHGGKHFDVLMDAHGQVMLCLHPWEAHGHPTMMDRSITPGNGLILYFRTAEMEAVRRRAGDLGIAVEEEVHLNTNSNRREFSLRDPDGYYITISEFHEYEG